MLCSAGIVNEIIAGTFCKIIMFPLKWRKRSHLGEELTRLVKRRLIREGALCLMETRPSRARAFCFLWKWVTEHGACVHCAQSAVALFPWQCVRAGLGLRTRMAYL